MQLPLFPLRTVLYPGMMLPLHIFEPRYREMINLCLEQACPFGVLLIRKGSEAGGPAEPHPVGTYGLVSRVERLPDGRMNIEMVGQERFRVLALNHDQAYLTGTVEDFPLADTVGAAARRAADRLMPWLERYLRLLGEAAEASFDSQPLPRAPHSLAWLAAIIAQIPPAEKQTLLNQASAVDLLNGERAIYRREISLVQAMLRSSQSRNDASRSPN